MSRPRSYERSRLSPIDPAGRFARPRRRPPASSLIPACLYGKDGVADSRRLVASGLGDGRVGHAPCELCEYLLLPLRHGIGVRWVFRVGHPTELDDMASLGVVHGERHRRLRPCQGRAKNRPLWR